MTNQRGTKRKNAASIIYGITAIVSLILGSIYLFSSQFMPYHADALSTKWPQLDGEHQTLLLALMDVAGAGWIALGVVLLTLIGIPFRKNEPWAGYVIPLVILVFYVPTLLATLNVLNHTPASPPWYGNAIACASALAGVLIDKPWNTYKPKAFGYTT